MTPAVTGGGEFIARIGAPACWQGRQRFVILDSAFGHGDRFLAAWSAWRDDASRCTTLHVIGLDASPYDGIALDAKFGSDGSDNDDSTAATSIRTLAVQLAAARPPLTPGIHRLAFEAGAVQLLRVVASPVAAALRVLHAEVDAFFIDAATCDIVAGTERGMRRLLESVARLAAPRATVVLAAACQDLHADLVAAGFEVGAIEPESVGAASPHTIARFAPRHTAQVLPRRAASRAASLAADAPVVIVGAGLAGCAVAAALAEQGRSSIVIDRQDSVAAEASGNAAGLFHGVVHRADGRHARWHRAAALAARNAVAQALALGARGSVGGLLRIEPGASSSAAMQDSIDRLRLPADYVRAVDAREASELAGTRIDAPAWYFPQGGWVDPRGLARSFLQRAGQRVETRFGVAVSELRHDGRRWSLHDVGGRVVIEAAVVVVANAGGALDLLGVRTGPEATQGSWPVMPSRGQISALRASEWSADAMPRIPVAGAGYVLPATGGEVWFGASSDAGDGNASVRRSDHAGNVARLSALLPSAPAIDIDMLSGRTGCRWVSGDRLPVIGAVPAASFIGSGPSPDAAAEASRQDQPRFVLRAAGLFVMTALGSRGIAAASLGGPVLASLVTGAPVPVETDLLDAIDPARFVSRAARRGDPLRAATAAALQVPAGPIAGGSAGG